MLQKFKGTKVVPEAKKVTTNKKHHTQKDKLLYKAYINNHRAIKQYYIIGYAPPI